MKSKYFVLNSHNKLQLMLWKQNRPRPLFL